MIFVDSDAFIGINNPHDAHHKNALMLLEHFRSKAEILATSWEVIDEISTKLTYFFSKSDAAEFLESLAQHDIQIEFIDRETSLAAKDIFLSQKSKNVSMTDCANMAIAKKLGITTFFSFDEHYKKNGFTLLSLA